MIRNLLFVSFGSFVGGGLRYLLSRLIQNYTENAFPLGTFVVNLLGCFLIGIFYALFEHGNLLNSNYRLFLTVGLCGGFTTFSTFMNENFQLMKDANFFYTSLYISLSLIGGALAIFFGHLIIKLILET